MAQKSYLDKAGATKLVENVKAIEADIYSEINKKADASHTHAIADVTGLQTKLDQLDNKVEYDTLYDLTASTGSSNGAVTINLKSGGTSSIASETDSIHINGAGATTVTTDAVGTITIDSTDTTYNVVTTSTEGLMAPSDKEKLDGIAYNANNYVLPVAGSSNIGGVLSGGDITVDSSGMVTVNNDSHTHSAGTITSVNASAIEGVISEANLPSYVDDVVEYDTRSAFPSTGESGKIYVTLDTNLTYRWSGSDYVEISPSIALGETSSTAYRGDYGAAAYAHASAKGSAFSSGLYKITTNAEGHVTAATAVTKSDITALGIPASDTDTKVTQTVTTSNASYPLLLAPSGQSANTTTSSYFDSGVTLNPSTNTIAANISGNAATADEADTAIKATSLSAITTAGTGAAYTATVDGITALTAGANFIMIPHTQSTVVNPTLNVNSLGAKSLRQPLTNSTSSTTSAANTNWLGSGKPVRVTYNGTFWVADLVRPNAANLYGVLAIDKGGTGADNAADARVNLGIETPDGTTTSGNADYAEVGEWVDGNPNDEDRIGYFVAIDENTSGKTMVKATSTSDVRGVTVSAPAFSGNCSSDKYETETTTVTDPDTGEEIKTTITSHNLKKQYDYVAVMGMVSVIDNGTCTINGRCMPTDDGTAVPSPNNMGYQVIDRIDSTHILIAVEPSADMLVRIKEDVGELQTSAVTSTDEIEGVEEVGTVYATKGELALKADKTSIPTSTSQLTNDSGYMKSSDLSDWAKASTKPTYTASEVGALPSSTVVPSTTETWTFTLSDGSTVTKAVYIK